MSIKISKRILLIIILLIITAAIPLTLFVVSQQQDVRQQAASDADLVVSGIQLTDAGGNVRTVFGVNEDIYVKIRLKNQGTAKGISTDGRTYTQFYSNKSSAASPNEVSPDGIVLRNGEFNAGFEKVYESRWGGLNRSYYTQSFYFNKQQGGIYKARVYVNFDGKVDEADLTNNQATITYTVTSNYLGNNIYRNAALNSTQPSGFRSDECGTINGVTACYTQGSVGGNTILKLTNNSTTVKNAGGAVYKSYYDYPNPYPSCSPSSCPDQFAWIWTQTIYSARATVLDPGETSYLTLPVPSCNWQVDAFTGSSVLLSFHPPSQTYSQQGRLIGGGWLEQYNGLLECTPDIIPFPTPTPTVPPDQPTPTEAPTPTPEPTEAPTPTPEPTCVLPEQVTNVRITCPYCGQ